MVKDRIVAFALSNMTLLLFTLGLTKEDMISERGKIPWHGPTDAILQLLGDVKQQQSLHQHYCLAVEKVEDVKHWEEWFAEQNVKMLGTMDWERGGRSVYFEDPDGHIGEVGSRGIWPHY